VGEDTDNLSVQEVTTINISQRGALLTGVRGIIRLGSEITLARLHKREQFRGVWLGNENTRQASQVGLSAVDPASSFWNDVIETKSAAQHHAVEGHAFEHLPVKARARAREPRARRSKDFGLRTWDSERRRDRMPTDSSLDLPNPKISAGS
jgi:hypothetical protein